MEPSGVVYFGGPYYIALRERLGDHALDWPRHALIERCGERLLAEPRSCGRAIGIDIRQRAWDGAQLVG